MADARKWNFTVEQLMKHGYSRKEAEKEADKVMKDYKQMEEKGVFSSASASSETYKEYAKQVEEGKIEDTGMHKGLSLVDDKVEILNLSTQQEEQIWGKKPKTALPSIPTFNFGLGSIKKGAQTTAIVLMVFVGLIIYLIFVKGKGASGVTVGQTG